VEEVSLVVHYAKNTSHFVEVFFCISDEDSNWWRENALAAWGSSLTRGVSERHPGTRVCLSAITIYVVQVFAGGNEERIHLHLSTKHSFFKECFVDPA